jgi:hypothetical protein
MSLDQSKWNDSSAAEQLHNDQSGTDFKVPDHWLRLDHEARLNSKLSDDFCFINEANSKISRYIRGVLEMPSGHQKSNGLKTDLNVWISVCEQTWLMYWRGFRTGKYRQASSTGYLSNTIVGYANYFNLPAMLYFRSAYERPLVRFDDHSGMSFSEPINHTGHKIIDAQSTTINLVH